MSRCINAICYIFSGIFMLVLVAQKGGGAGIVLVSLACIGYGVYIGLTRRSYWVSTYTYIIPVVAIGYVFAR
jgi:hypothetical protein